MTAAHARTRTRTKDIQARVTSETKLLVAKEARAQGVSESAILLQAIAHWTRRTRHREAARIAIDALAHAKEGDVKDALARIISLLTETEDA